MRGQAWPSGDPTERRRRGEWRRGEGDGTMAYPGGGGECDGGVRTVDERRRGRLRTRTVGEAVEATELTGLSGRQRGRDALSIGAFMAWRAETTR
jgi:hypothetical protein